MKCQCSQAFLGVVLYIKPVGNFSFHQNLCFYPRTRGLKILIVFGDFPNWTVLGEKTKDEYTGPQATFIN